MPMPTILKPQQLWTGKQVISALILHVCPSSAPQLPNLDGKFRQYFSKNKYVISEGNLFNSENQNSCNCFR